MAHYNPKDATALAVLTGRGSGQKALAALRLLSVLLSKRSQGAFDGKALLEKLAIRCLNPDPNVRPTAKEVLHTMFGSHPHLQEPEMFTPRATLNVDDLASEATERWRLVPVSKQAYGYVTYRDDEVYLSTAPIDGAEESPVRRLSFELRCHDQGAEYTSTDFHISPVFLSLTYVVV